MALYWIVTKSPNGNRLGKRAQQTRTRKKLICVCMHVPVNGRLNGRTSLHWTTRNVRGTSELARVIHDMDAYPFIYLRHSKRAADTHSPTSERADGQTNGWTVDG